MTITKRCPHCNQPTSGSIQGYCSWDCHDHDGDEHTEREAA